jgi:hypothetical protein
MVGKNDDLSTIKSQSGEHRTLGACGRECSWEESSCQENRRFKILDTRNGGMEALPWMALHICAKKKKKDRTFAVRMRFYKDKKKRLQREEKKKEVQTSYEFGLRKFFSRQPKKVAYTRIEKNKK